MNNGQNALADQKKEHTCMRLHIPLDLGHSFRSIPATHYARSRPSVTVDAGHSLRSIAATRYGHPGPP